MMNRPVTLFTAQWADLPLETVIEKARSFGYHGLELACWGDHLEVHKADQAYCDARKALMEKNGLKMFSISTHLVGQAVCDIPDQRHKSILPDYVWGDGDSEGVRKRAAEEIIRTGETAKKLGLKTVNGFTGSSIWSKLYSFPPVSEEMIGEGFADFARRWTPILDAFAEIGVRYALEVHPTEIAFDIETAKRALKALNGHPAFGFNYDPSHLGYQGVDYIKFIYEFSDRIFHVHMKDVSWNSFPGTAGVFGGHLPFGDNRRYWNFRSVGRGRIDFEGIIRALNDIGYDGPLSVEWEDSGMDREAGAAESCRFVKEVDFVPGRQSFDAAFEKDK